MFGGMFDFKLEDNKVVCFWKMTMSRFGRRPLVAYNTTCMQKLILIGRLDRMAWHTGKCKEKKRERSGWQQSSWFRATKQIVLLSWKWCWQHLFAMLAIEKHGSFWLWVLGSEGRDNVKHCQTYHHSSEFSQSRTHGTLLATARHVTGILPMLCPAASQRIELHEGGCPAAADAAPVASSFAHS